MLQDISQADFKYFANYVQKMKDTHEKEFMQEINPDLVRALYRGKKYSEDKNKLRMDFEREEDLLLTLSLIFPAANTILPNLYYQNPKPIVIPEGQGSWDDSALMSAVLRYYMKVNKAKMENQDAVLNSYHMGLGWKKIGYRKLAEPSEQVASEPESIDQEKPERMGMMNMMANVGNAIGSFFGGQETGQPVIENLSLYDDQPEGIWNASISPLDVYLDHTSDLMHPKTINHRMKRTLYDLMSFGGYDKGQLEKVWNKTKVQKGTRFDTREVELELNELHIKQRNGIWILSYVEGFDFPLQYERSICQNGFQFEPLSLTFEPGVRYPISHLKIAGQSQMKLDDLATLFLETIARSRNLVFIDESALADGQLEAVRQNRTGGIIVTKRNPVGSFAHASSPSVGNDIPTLMQLCQQSIVQVTGGDQQQISGQSKNDTLGQDELARVGTKMRESGMQDRVRDFMISQFDKEGYLIQKFDDAQKKLDITGEDYADPIMAQEKQKQQVEFMTMQNPIGIRRQLEEKKFVYDMNIEDAIKPDKAIQRKQYESMILTSSNPSVSQSLLQNNKIFRTDLAYEQWLRSHDGVGNPMRFLQPLDSMQKAALQVQQLMMQGGAGMTSQPKPAQEPSDTSVKSAQQVEQ